MTVISTVRISSHVSSSCSCPVTDYAEIIGWATKQPWSGGKVGLTGISYLGLNQWATAARQPPGLAAIIPWEGFSDYYRDACRHGGIYCNGVRPPSARVARDFEDYNLTKM